MPKIVDHEAYREELALKAAGIFTEYGYSGLGMRRIAEELGISKSALYHYFPTKEDLFAACTAVVTRFGAEHTLADRLPENASLGERLDALIESVEGLEAVFKQELSLLLDYIRNMTPAEVAKDENMQYARKRYLRLMEAFVGKEDALPVMNLMMGALLMRLLDGKMTDFGELSAWLEKHLRSE